MTGRATGGAWWRGALAGLGLAAAGRRGDDDEGAATPSLAPATTAGAVTTAGGRRRLRLTTRRPHQQQASSPPSTRGPVGRPCARGQDRARIRARHLRRARRHRRERHVARPRRRRPRRRPRSVAVRAWRRRRHLRRGQGLVVDLGQLAPVAKIGWYVPAYALEEHPELATREGLEDPELASIFATAESGDQGQSLMVDPSYVSDDEQIIQNLELLLSPRRAGSEAAETHRRPAGRRGAGAAAVDFCKPHGGTPSSTGEIELLVVS